MLVMTFPADRKVSLASHCWAHQGTWTAIYTDLHIAVHLLRLLWVRKVRRRHRRSRVWLKMTVLTSVLGQEVDVGLRVVLQLIGLDHDVGGGAEGAVDARRSRHDARVRQRKAVALLARGQNHGRIAKSLRKN